MSDLPTVDVRIKVDGPSPGNTRVYFDGIDVTMLLLAKPFEVHLGDDESPDPYLVIGLPVGELDLEMTDAALHAIAIHEKTGEVA